MAHFGLSRAWNPGPLREEERPQRSPCAEDERGELNALGLGLEKRDSWLRNMVPI